MIDRREMMRMAAPAIVTPVTLFAVASSSTSHSAESTDSSLTEVISKAIDDFEPVHNSGIALAVIKNKKLYYTRGFGWRDRSTSGKVDPATFFAIGSATKAFTSTIVAVCAQDGKVALDQPVKKYLPDFGMKDP